jgi:hypothetical protein
MFIPKKKDYVGIAKKKHNPYLRIGLGTHAWWLDQMGVGPTLFFFFIFISGTLQNKKVKFTNICIKKYL